MAKIMETEPGGENTQYESANTFTKSPAKESGQLKDTDANEPPSEADEQAQAEKTARGEKKAENMRHGEAISEHGFGGETVGNSGSANQGSGFGATNDDMKSNRNEKEAEGQTRREQGYSGGSGVGA